MNDASILAEWMPDDEFNLLDYRDFSSEKEVIPPPYSLTFRFPQEVVVGRVSVDVIGWGMCGSTTALFSRVVISKNGNEVVYDGKFEQVMGLRKDTRLVPKKDWVRVTMFPACPAHMVKINSIVFLSPLPQAQSEPDPSKDNKQERQQDTVLPLPLFTDYWYLYATGFVFFIIFVLSLLFMTMHGK